MFYKILFTVVKDLIINQLQDLDSCKNEYYKKEKV